MCFAYLGAAAYTNKGVDVEAGARDGAILSIDER